MNFLIIHGSYGNPNENWFPWLKEELEKLGHTVYLPKFPTPEGQSLDNWTKVVEEEKIPFDENLIIVAHSIGPAFALALLETRKCKACFFVSSFLSFLGDDTFDKINRTFVTKKFNWGAIKKNCPRFVVYHGDDDPYVPLKIGQDVADKIGVGLKIIPNGGHLNSEKGYTRFPGLLEDILEDIKKKVIQ